jgi:hypothetical protein
VLVTPCGCISLPVTFRTAENFRMESVLFDVAEVSVPFNTILARPALYQFMAVAHYGYLVLKMPSPMASSRSRDRDVGACAVEKLQALAAAREAAEEPRARTPRHRARAGAARSQHPTCNPLTRKTSP